MTSEIEIIMKATELRIGNWVIARDLFNSPSRSFIQVESINETGINLRGNIEHEDIIVAALYDFDHLEPIAMTPEILEKCGFVERAQHDNDGNERGYYWVNKKGFVLSSDDFGASFYLKAEFKKIKVEYLHTFQNLYFALESEELPINITADALSS